MKRNAIYSLRMPKEVRRALQEAADWERRSVSSILNKIVVDHLVEKGFLEETEFWKERRQFARKKTGYPASILIKKQGQRQAIAPGVIRDISQGGVSIRCPKVAVLDAEAIRGASVFNLCLKGLSGSRGTLRVGCDTVRLNETKADIRIGARFTAPESENSRMLCGCLQRRDRESADRRQERG